MSAQALNNNRIEAALESVFVDVARNTGGQLADYPVLRDAEPDKFGLACVIPDGSIIEHGDSRLTFPLQSCVKPFILIEILKQKGIRFVEEYVGVEALQENPLIH